MRKIHSTSIDNFHQLNLKKYNYIENRIFFKPVGLWYGYELDDNISTWMDWVGENNFYLDRYINHYELIINTSNFLIVDNNDTLSFINNNYKLISNDDIINQFNYIDWKKLKKDYDGIEFILENLTYDRCSLEFLWLSTLDVSSGCLWNLDAINNIIKINN